MKDQEKNAIKEKPSKSFIETVTLMLRKKWLTNTAQTVLLIQIGRAHV